VDTGGWCGGPATDSGFPAPTSWLAEVLQPPATTDHPLIFNQFCNILIIFYLMSQKKYFLFKKIDFFMILFLNNTCSVPNYKHL
jgi:hypothetical protein